MNPRRRLLTVIASGAALCLVLSSCRSDNGMTGDDSTGAAAVTRTIDAAEVRTDREPITNRFPLLGDFTDAHWVGGRLGDDRAPGPSTYFIEAVVRLAPADLARLSGQFDLAPAAADPQPPQSLIPFLSDAGRWSTSSELEQGFGPPDWVSQVFVQLDGGVVYVSARGE